MEYRHLGSPSVKKYKTLMPAANFMLPMFWNASGVLNMEFLTKGVTVNSDRYCCKITITQAKHSQNQTGKKRLFLLHHDNAPIQDSVHSGSINSSQPRFGTVG
ncbi:hypothetical protein TNCV_1861471 [Trichonephila clavipes]|nr:hypothetical protein TNCV_1861471 [Trichonephila clavipes]